jgi:hypothetical protein
MIDGKISCSPAKATLKHLVMGKGSPDRGRGNNEMQLRMFISNKNVLNVRVDEDALRLKALPWGRQTVQP